MPSFSLCSLQVLYHLFIGVDLIYLYDNEDAPTYHRMFSCNPRVKVIPFPWLPGADHGVQVRRKPIHDSSFFGGGGGVESRRLSGHCRVVWVGACAAIPST
jgi:hypothetical protein